MKFCILNNIDFHPEVHGTPAQYYDMILRQAEILEQYGYDSVWYSEHHYNGYSFGNPAVIASAVAQRTSRIRLGTGVVLAPLNHPIRIAEEYAMLDVLSNGRVEFGVGRGFMSYAYELFGVDQSKSAERMREAIEFVDKAWRADGPFDFAGDWVNCKDYHFFPQPVQSPIPIYVAAARTPDSYRWAGQQGHHLCTSFFSPQRDLIAQGVRDYRAEAAAAGHDVSALEVAGVVQMYCAPDKEEAVHVGGKFAENYYKFFAGVDAKGPRPAVGPALSQASAVDFNRNNQVLLGDPADLIERIGQLRDQFGATMLQFEVAQGGADPELMFETLKLFGREVIPAFR